MSLSLNHCWNQRPRAVVVAWIFFLALFFHLAILSNEPPPRLQDPRPIGVDPSAPSPRLHDPRSIGVDPSDDPETDPDVLRKQTKNYGSSVVVHLNTTWNDSIAASQRAEYSRRQDRVKKICATTKAFQRSLENVHRTILWDEQDHLMWCPVLKAASTTWMQNFGQLAKSRQQGKDGRMRKKSHQVYKKPAYAEPMLKRALKFMIARDPFKRLLSAYRDKMLVEHNLEGHFARLQKEIVKQYQIPYSKETKRRKRRIPETKNIKRDINKNKNKNKNEKDSTQNKNKKEKDLPNCEDLTPDASVDDADITVYLNTSTSGGSSYYHPTFTQFLMRVRDDMRQMWKTGGECAMNKHWRPYWVSCSPCQIDYDVLAKFETIDLDNEYIIQESKLQGEFVNMHTHASINDEFKSTSEAVNHYFSEVPVALLREIVELYKPDFQLFEYDPEPYLKLGKSVTLKVQDQR